MGKAARHSEQSHRVGSAIPMACGVLSLAGMFGCIVPENLTTDTAGFSHVVIVNDCAPNAPCTSTATTQPPFGNLVLSSTMSSPPVALVAIDPNPDTTLLKARVFSQPVTGGQLAKFGTEDFIAMTRDTSPKLQDHFLGTFTLSQPCTFFHNGDSIWIVVTNSDFVGLTDAIPTGACCSDRNYWHLVCP